MLFSLEVATEGLLLLLSPLAHYNDDFLLAFALRLWDKRERDAQCLRTDAPLTTTHI